MQFERRDGDAKAAPQEPSRFTPQWSVGDLWIVRYHLRIVTPGDISGSFSEPVYGDMDMEYRVDTITASGYVEISVRPISANRGFPSRRTFFPSGALESIIPPIPLSEPLVATSPYLELHETGVGNIGPEWPAFPLQLEPALIDFGNGLEQHVERSNGVWWVTLVRRGDWYGGTGFPAERKLEQLWEEGRPWWSSHSIRSWRHPPGQTEEVSYVEITGKVIEWHTARER